MRHWARIRLVFLRHRDPVQCRLLRSRHCRWHLRVYLPGVHLLLLLHVLQSGCSWSQAWLIPPRRPRSSPRQWLLDSYCHDDELWIARSSVVLRRCSSRHGSEPADADGSLPSATTTIHAAARYAHVATRYAHATNRYAHADDLWRWDASSTAKQTWCASSAVWHILMRLLSSSRITTQTFSDNQCFYQS